MTDDNPKPTSESQAQLAQIRTVLAMDRTLLAWVRTSLSLNAFGFTLAKFVHSLVSAGSLRLNDAWLPRQLGITLMILGIVSLLCGAADYWRSVRKMQTSTAASPWSASFIVSLILAVISMLLMVNLLSDLQS